MIKIKFFLKKALDLDTLETFSIKLLVSNEWITEIGKYLMENGLAIQSEIVALKETSGNEIEIEFKKHPGIQEEISRNFKVDPSYMTVSYGPYVVDDYMKDKELTPEMIIP